MRSVKVSIWAALVALLVLMASPPASASSGVKKVFAPQAMSAVGAQILFDNSATDTGVTPVLTVVVNTTIEKKALFTAAQDKPAPKPMIDLASNAPGEVTPALSVQGVASYMPRANSGTNIAHEGNPVLTAAYFRFGEAVRKV